MLPTLFCAWDLHLCLRIWRMLFIQRMYTIYLLLSLGIKPITLALLARALLFNLQEGISQNYHTILYFTSLIAYQRSGGASKKEACIQLQLVQIFKVINATNVLQLSCTCLI